MDATDTIASSVCFASLLAHLGTVLVPSYNSLFCMFHCISFLPDFHFSFKYKDRLFLIWKEQSVSNCPRFLVNTFLLIFGEHQPFRGGTETPVLDFWWLTSALGFKARVDPRVHAMDSSDSPLGATPAEHFDNQHGSRTFMIHILAHVNTNFGWTQTLDRTVWAPLAKCLRKTFVSTTGIQSLSLIAS